MKDDIKILENRMVRYKDLINVKTVDNNEPFTVVDRKIIPTAG